MSVSSEWVSHVCDEPIICRARMVWFHDEDLSAALHAAACWLHEHHFDGEPQAVHVTDSTVDDEGHDVSCEDEGAIQRWHVAVVQEL